MRGAGACGVFVGFIGLCVYACGSGPTTPADPGVRLLYIEGQTVVAPGESAQLVAFEMQTGKSIANVSAQARWTSTNTAVATMTRGLLRAVVPGTASVSVALSNVSGNAAIYVVGPAAAPISFRGSFAGTLTFTSCDRLAGEGRSPCVVGASFPLELAITEQTGAAVSGTLLVIDRTTGPVRGYVDGNGELNVAGTLSIPGEALSRMIRRMKVRRDGSAITGAGESDYAVITAFGPQLVRQAFTVQATLK